MRRLDILLLDGLDGDEAHAGAAHRFTDGLGIVSVVLVALDVRFDELRRDQLHAKSACLELSCPMVRTAATFHANLTAGLDLLQHRLKPAITRQTLPPDWLVMAIHAVDLVG